MSDLIPLKRELRLLVQHPTFMNTTMWFIWLLRSDIRENALPSDQEAQKEFVAWWLLFGAAEYPSTWHWTAEHAAIAMETVSFNAVISGPRLLRRLYEARSDLKSAFPLVDKESFANFLCWYRAYGPLELPAAPSLGPEYLAITDGPSEHREWCKDGTQVPRMAITLSRARSCDILKSVKARQLLASWYIGGGWTSVPRPHNPFQTLLTTPKKLKRGGVNLIGFVQGQSGLGQDLCSAVAAFDATKIPYVLIDASDGHRTPQNDHSAPSPISNDPIYDVSIYFMSAFDMAALYVRRGKTFFVNQYCIGYWPWELPSFPDIWHEVYGLVHEIWTGSEFTAKAYVASPVTVRCLPCPVMLPKVQPVDRSVLGLSNPKSFLFMYSFDPNSYAARKNPIALVRAFWRAFQRKNDGVSLLIRVNGVISTNITWRDFLESIALDSRIILLEGTLGRDLALGVVASCDCFVSPHRSEGFGRNIAEAILLEKPVISTGFSGCLDFLYPEECIHWRKRVVGPGEYPFGEGMYWAEPSERDMARKMRRIKQAALTDPTKERKRLLLRALEFKRRYGQFPTGLAFKNRLRELCLLGRSEQLSYDNTVPLRRLTASVSNC